MKKTPNRSTITVLVPLVILGALLAAATTRAASDRGRCVRTELPWPVVLPDGSVHDPGQLRICSQGSFTPVEGLQAVWVGERFAGLFLGRRLPSEGPVEQRLPFVVFRRAADDLWELQGYALPLGDGLVGYSLSRDAGRGHSATERWITHNGSPPETPIAGGWAFLLAAGPD